jgi:hypothetical protein
MMHISPKQPDRTVNKRIASLFSAHAVDLEALARFLRLIKRVPRSLKSETAIRMTADW